MPQYPIPSLNTNIQMLPKGSHTKSLAIHYLYYVIANTLQACGEYTRVYENDMTILAKAAIPNSLSNNSELLLRLHLQNDIVCS
jgi:hypothetical protein